MIRNERGLTLIETLITLSILSFISVIIWSVFTNGMNYTKSATSKNMMQQEANYIITRLTKIHQTAKNYSINSIDCEITLSYSTKTQVTTTTEEFQSPNLCLTVDFDETVDPNNINPDLIDVNVHLTISENNNINNKIEVDTFLYRLKGGGN